ncbi:hypothetical protein YDYSG_04490 [Paenibacillus tyrfis]|uniref:helix-turn-helix domain-containing protein n=1 Tax=Paenibacillus tyrfis TaxID=1501230 RepID=UPI0024924023|nr:helix-turn-helix domain-containing protein [Paenibacillus tyrfis]GLI04419.1 hypothetical protein YDYSG_04490 [Paenibacillus tyrfis]
MEKERFNYNISEDDFSEILDKAKSGDKDSIQKILEIFEDEIKNMAKFPCSRMLSSTAKWLEGEWKTGVK